MDKQAIVELINKKILEHEQELENCKSTLQFNAKPNNKEEACKFFTNIVLVS